MIIRLLRVVDTSLLAVPLTIHRIVNFSRSNTLLYLCFTYLLSKNTVKTANLLGFKSVQADTKRSTSVIFMYSD